MGLKINIGCGSQILPGWVNVDHAPIPGILIASVLDLPLATNSAECAIMFDVIEHLHPLKEAPRGLREVLRVLQPGGVLRVSTLDLKKLAGAYAGGRIDGFEPASQPRFYSDLSPALQFSAHAFGNHAETTPAGVYDGHQALYDEEALLRILKETGFREVIPQRPRESLSEAIRNSMADRWPAISVIVEGVKW